GGTGSAAHGLAAVYLGCSIVFGHSMMRWADQRFAHRFAGGPPPVRPPRFGRARAAYERRAWLQHLLAYVTSGVVLGVFTLLVGEADRAWPLWQPMRVWGLVLLIDLVVSLSYTLAPKRAPEDFAAVNRTAPGLHSNPTGNARSD
ncbi:MAG: 2TM domain-containing protein, partial [Actinoplanes sp.]